MSSSHIIPQKLSAKLSNFEQFNERYIWYRFELEAPSRLTNEAGQYMMIEVAPNTMRAYSMCDRPDVDSSFEIVLDTAPNGIGVNFIKNLQFGDQIHCLGPLGRLTVTPEQKNASGSLYFLATGSGISPFHAIITDLLQLQGITKPLVLIWNVNFSREFFWLQDFQELQTAFPNFTFLPVVSGDDPSWHLDHGFVADVLAKFDLQPTDHFYMCGSPIMIQNTTNYLTTDRDLDASQITTEQFFAGTSS